MLPLGFFFFLFFLIETTSSSKVSFHQLSLWVCVCTWSLREWAGCFQTELLETLVRVALSCAPGAAFVLAHVCAAEWADNTAEYWSPVPALPLYRSPRSFFIHFSSENEGMSWCFRTLCLQGVSTVYNHCLLPPQQLLDLWWSSVTDLISALLQ